MMEITEAEQKEKKRIKRNEYSLRSLRDFWDNIKHNIQIIGAQEEEEKKKVYDKIFEEIIVENLPKVVK